MDNTKYYNELADEIMEAAWDIQDVMEGRNDFSESTVLALSKIKKQCEFFIKIYNESINMKSSEIAENKLRKIVAESIKRVLREHTKK